MNVTVTHRQEYGDSACEKSIEVTRVNRHEMTGVTRKLMAMASRKPRVARRRRRAARTTPRRKR
jgi:hypothetical protein